MLNWSQQQHFTTNPDEGVVWRRNPVLHQTIQFNSHHDTHYLNRARPRPQIIIGGNPAVSMERWEEEISLFSSTPPQYKHKRWQHNIQMDFYTLWFYFSSPKCDSMSTVCSYIALLMIINFATYQWSVVMGVSCWVTGGQVSILFAHFLISQDFTAGQMRVVVRAEHLT